MALGTGAVLRGVLAQESTTASRQPAYRLLAAAPQRVRPTDRPARCSRLGNRILAIAASTRC